MEVLEALYDSPSHLAQAVLPDGLEYINALALSVAAPGAKPKRAILRLHFGFLVGHLLPSLSESLQEITLKRLLLPFLMFSKPRQHTAELVWDAIEAVIPGSKAMELLKGCSDIVKKDENGERTVDTMVTTNLGLTSKIAENVLRSDRFTKHLDTLMAMLQDENSHSRAFGFLVMRALVERMSGAHQVEVANKVLDALKLEQLPALDDLAQDQNLDLLVSAEAVAKAVVVKPSSKTTLAWLIIGVIFAITNMSQPANKEIDWFKDFDTVSLFHLLRIMTYVLTVLPDVPRNH